VPNVASYIHKTPLGLLTPRVGGELLHCHSSD